MEAIAGGEDFEKILKEKISKPLNMVHTFYTTPEPSLGVIPSYQGEYWWDFDIGEEAPSVLTLLSYSVYQTHIFIAPAVSFHLQKTCLLLVAPFSTALFSLNPPQGGG